MAPHDLHKKFSQMFRKQKPGIPLSPDKDACANERGFPITPPGHARTLTSHAVDAFRYGAEYLGFVDKPKPVISAPFAYAKNPKTFSEWIPEEPRKRESGIEQVKQSRSSPMITDPRGSWGDKRASWISTASWVSTIKPDSPGKADKRRSWGGQGDSFQSFAARQRAELARQVAEDRIEPIRDFSAFHLRRPFGPLNSHPPTDADLEVIGRARAAADIMATEAARKSPASP